MRRVTELVTANNANVWNEVPLTMANDELTCGQELAASAAVPELFSALFKHVAANLREHAAWVGTMTENATREHDAMIGVARGYEEISSAADRTAELMRGMKSLAPASHDPKTFDRKKFASWMKTKIELQQTLANLLLDHAEQSRRALEEIG